MRANIVINKCLKIIAEFGIPKEITTDSTKYFTGFEFHTYIVKI